MLLNIQFKSISFLLIVLVFLTACSSRNEKSLKQSGLYFAAGTQSLMNKQYTEALRNLVEADKLDPENSDILTNLAMAYYFKGEKELAIQHLNKALKINKDNSDAKTNLASIYYKDGRFDDAEKIYKQVLRDLTYDKQARTFYNLGLLELDAHKDLVAAENYFKKSINEDDNYCPAYYQLGMVQYQRRQFNSALKNFKEATLGSCVTSPAPHYHQALSLMGLKRYSEARMKLDEVESKFRKTVYAVKARQKMLELNEIENKSDDSFASRKVIESPDF